MGVVYFYCLFLSELSVIFFKINTSLFDTMYNRVRREKVDIIALPVFGKRRRNVNIFNGYSLIILQQAAADCYRNMNGGCCSILTAASNYAF